MDNFNHTIAEFPIGETEYDIPFDYLSRRFVKVSFTGNEGARQELVNLNDYRFVSKTRIRITASYGPQYTTLEMRRLTSATDRIVDFNDGSILRADDLNVANTQAIHIAEEARDTVGSEILVAVATAQASAREAKGYADSAYGSKNEANETLEEIRKIVENAGDEGTLIELAQPDGYSKIGGIFQREAPGTSGVEWSIDAWEGQRGEFDVIGTVGQPVSGAAVSFGGDKNRGMLSLSATGVPTFGAMMGSWRTAYARTGVTAIDSGRPDLMGESTSVVKFNTPSRITDGDCYEMEIGQDASGNPMVKFATALKTGQLAPLDQWSPPRTLRVADENRMVVGSEIFCKFRLPIEDVQGSLDPAWNYRAAIGVSGSNTMHLTFNSRFNAYIVSMINSGLNAYISMRCNTNANGNDVTKFGLYQLSPNAQFTGGSAIGNAMWLHIAGYTKDPDGRNFVAANAPGTDSNVRPNYTDVEVYITTATLSPATGLASNNRYNGFSKVLKYDSSTLFAIKDIIGGHSPSKEIYVVTDVTATKDNDGKVIGVTPKYAAIRQHNDGYVYEHSYDRSQANGVVITPVDYLTCLGARNDWDVSIHTLNVTGLKEYK